MNHQLRVEIKYAPKADKFELYFFYTDSETKEPQTPIIRFTRQEFKSFMENLLRSYYQNWENDQQPPPSPQNFPERF